MATVSELAFRITADIAQFEKATQTLGGRIQDLGRNVSSTGKTMTKMVTGPMLAVGAGLFALAKTTANAGDEVQKMALRTGFSTEALSELKHAANLSGTSLDQLETASKRMSRVMLDAERGMASAERSIAELGLTTKDLVGLAPEEQFMRLAGALAEVEDESKRAALAQEIFGRAGTQLLPMLAGGAAGLESMRQEAHALGLVFDQEAADAAAKFNDDLTRLRGAMSGLGREIGTKVIPIVVDKLLPALQEHLIPAIRSLVERVVSLIQWFSDLDPRWRSVISLAVGMVLALGPVLTVVGKLITVGGGLIKMFAGLVGGIGKAITAVKAAGGALAFLAANPVGLVIAAIAAVIAAGVLLWKNWDKVKEFGQATWGKLSAFMDTTLGKIAMVMLGPIGIGLLLIKNWDKVAEVAKRVWNGIVDTIKGAVNAIIRTINGFIKLANRVPGINIPLIAELELSTDKAERQAQAAQGIMSAWHAQQQSDTRQGGKPGVGVSPLDHLETFAGGGRVSGPMGAPRLVMAHGGETVRTPQQEASLRGGGITINVTGNHIASDYDIDRIGDLLVSRLRIAGVVTAR